MHRIICLLLSLLVHLSYCDTNYRLDTPIRPTAYALLLTPYFDTNDTNAFTFDGEVTISFTTTENTNIIKIHSHDLQYTASNISVSSGNNIVQLNSTSPLTFDEKYSFAFINLQNDLQVNTTYTLRIAYKGPIREDLNGFYRNYYYEQGVKKWLGATQMEPVHARKVFPCFDEPDLKARFTLSILRPGHFEPSLTNTELQERVELPDGNVLEIFHPTPIMSTYLVAFLVSEWKPAMNSTINGREFGIYTRPEAANQSYYAFDFGSRVVQALGDFFQIDYYSTDEHLRLDHVALPDFNAGAMENWGLIKYREALLLYVPEVSTPYYKYRVSQIVAHETTHMWFGNLVTCHWWSNTWLNEGFANYFQDYITAMIEPEVGSSDALVTSSVYAAYDADDSPDSPPISNDNVNSPAEISAHFGTVTYQKAGSVIRMMHHFVGDEAFRIGLHSYLEENKFSNGYPNAMYTALHQGVNTTNSLAAYHVDITEVMHSWISKPGHPLLKVTIDYNTGNVQLMQKRFYEDPIHSSNETYEIPITFTTELNPQFNDTKPVFVMSAATHNFTIPMNGTSEPWVIFNVQETGLYRVDYDRHSWSIISSTLQGGKRTDVHHLNRAKIVNDLFAIFRADEENFEILFDILKFLENETDYSVWLAAIRNLHRLRNSYLGHEALPDIEHYILQVLQPIIDVLGYSVRPSDDYDTLRNRMQVLELACKLDHQGCVNNAIVLFRNLKDNGTEISPSLRPVSYCHGLRFGSAADYDYLWERMSSTNVANEARVIADALACTTDEEKLRSYLVSTLEEDSPIRSQDQTVPLSGILSNYSNVHLAMEGLRDNYTLWSSIYPSMDTVLASVASALHTEEEFNEFEAILSSCTDCSEESLAAARKSLNQAKKASQWAVDHTEDILKSLRSAFAPVLPTYIVLLTGLLATMIARF